MMNENKNSKETISDEPVFNIPIQNMRENKKVKKERKKPDIHIPIFEINVAYYEKKN